MLTNAISRHRIRRPLRRRLGRALTALARAAMRAAGLPLALAAWLMRAAGRMAGIGHEWRR